MIDEMSCLKMEETTLNKYKADLNNQSMQKLQIMQIYVDRDLIWINEKLLKCQEKQSRLQKTMEDYVNESFDVRYIKQCIEYGCGGGMGWDQIIKDAYREKAEEDEKRLAIQQQQQQQQDILDFENQTGIFDFQPSNGPEDGYVGIVPCDSSIFDPY